MKGHIFSALVLSISAMLFPLSANVWADVSDNAGHSDYASWDTGDNGTWGSGWAFSVSGSGGRFMGSATSNGAGDSNADGDINTSGRAWGLWANSGGVSEAVRQLPVSMGVGNKITVNMDNGYQDNGSTVGMGFRNASNQNVLEVYFVGGSGNYTVHGSSATDSGVAYTWEGVTVEFTLTAATTYSVKITRKLNGANNTVTGNLASPAGGQVITNIRFFNAFAGSGSTNDAFYNSMALPVTDWEVY